MSGAATRRVRARRRARGFTLIELVVALIGGLIVGIAVVGLSKEATNTFHEDMRAAQAQFGLRTAIDRLRADVSRAGFMATPNVYGDPQLVSNYTSGTGAGTFAGATIANLKALAGIRLIAGGSMSEGRISAAGFPASTTNGTDKVYAYSAGNNLSPDVLDITGAMNSVDVFTVQTFGTSTCGGTSVRLLLATNNPPAYRILNSGDGDAAMKRAFIPVSTYKFLMRMQDLQGRVQYLEVCDAGVTTGSPWVDVTGTVTILDASTNGGGAAQAGGVTSFYTGALINPVLTVRYKLAPPPAAYADLDPTSDPSRFDLYRFYLDSAGTEVGTPELIAEYAVDLKFAFTVDDTAAATPPSLVRTLKHFAFDVDPPAIGPPNSITYGSAVAAASATGPQRIRSVRMRLATRTALPDRTTALAPPAYTPTDYTNLFRYCTSTASPCTAYARVRTTITEVSLNNMSRGLY